jgi:hypothetical protein
VSNDKKLPNLMVLRPVRVKGLHYAARDVVAKADFATSGDDRTGDWLDLCAMEPPVLVQTNEAPSRAGAAQKRGRKPAAAPLPPAPAA